MLGALILLAMMGTTFITFQTLENRIAGGFADDIRAKLAAQSGIDSAVAAIEADLRQSGTRRPSVYWGDVTSESGQPNAAVPLDEATNPSFAIEAGSIGDPTYDPYTAADPAPQPVVIAGQVRGVSSAMETGRYARHGEVATVRVSGTQGLLNVNDGVHEDGLTHRPVTRQMERLINLLCQVPGVDVTPLGTSIVDNRPLGGYRSKRELRALMTEAQYEKLAPFLTTDSWIDPNVCLPVPLSATAANSGMAAPAGVHLWRGDPAVYRRGRNKDYLGAVVTAPLGFTDPDNRVYGLDELNPTWIQLTRRAPVSVNEAPREVLVALIASLRGFFLLEGRKHFPNTTAGDAYGMTGAYAWMQTYHTLSPAKMAPYPNYPWWSAQDESDEIGRLHLTKPFGMCWNTASDDVQISPHVVADEIVACRAGVASATFDYSTAAFGGPFRTWRQFHAFCDNLVEIGAIQDARTVFTDFAVAGGNYGNVGAPVVSSLQQRLAAQAAADVLKANFNPNLHLNELNPDANRFTLVDKTDLVVMSTEFFLGPSGTYEIESLGRVLRPVSGDDALTAPDNELMGQRSMRAVVKLFDVHRETSQKHFHAGTLGAAGAPYPATNNNRSVEVGPEPDNGPAAAECAWGGYVALPTIGGLGVDRNPATAVEATPFLDDATERLGSNLHAHFAWDDRLHHHVNGAARCVDLANHDVGGEGVENFAAPGETAARPYMADGTFRLARDFTLSPGETTPSLSARAPMDLRIDGIYSERHGAPAYWLSKQVWPDPIKSYRVRLNGVAAYWIKPSYRPETTWKTRVMLNASQSVHSYMPYGLQHAFAPAHDTPAGTNSSTEDLTPYYLKSIPAASFLFGFNQGGVATGSVNHAGHAHSPPKPASFAAHEWTHVVLKWKEISTYKTRWDIYVNGALAGSYTQRPLAHAIWSDSTPKLVGWSVRSDGSQNSIRLGSPSKAQADPGLRYTGWSTTDTSTGAANPAYGYRLEHAADCTFDEFYTWGYGTNASVDGAAQQALDLWQLGRYRAPDGTDGVFTSPPVTLPGVTGRMLAPASIDAEPSGASIPLPAAGARLIGMSWTLLGEALGPTGEAVIYDHSSNPPAELSARVEMTVGGVTRDDDAYSLFDVPLSGPVEYQARFQLDGATLSTILRATPVLDDVTFYYSSGTRFLEMQVE